MWIFILLLASASAFGPPRWLRRAGEAALGFNHGDACTYTRNDALRCIRRFIDADHDGEISASEFERSKRRYLPTQLRAAEWVLNRMGYYISINNVMKACDADVDGRLTISDWKKSTHTCMPHQSDLCKLRTICERAEAAE